MGQAINRRLVEAGWQVVAGDLPAALEASGPSGDSITAAEVDVTDRSSVERFVSAAEPLGTIRGVVNCAGIVRFTPMSGFEDADASAIWEVNVAGSARVSSAAVARMIEGGAIVNISSVTGYIGRLTGASLYGASKAGLVAFTRHLAAELAPPGIPGHRLPPRHNALPLSPSMRPVFR